MAESTAECSYTRYEDLEPLQPEPEAYEGQLKSLDWKVQFSAITALRQLSKHHSDVFLSLIDTLLPLLITLSDSIRSNLSKNALLLLTEMFLEPRPSHTHIAEVLVPGLLQKTISEKSFIKQQAAAAMQNLSRTAGTPAVMQALASLCWHKSGAICDNAFQYLKVIYETAPCDDVFHSAVGLLHSKRKKIEAGSIAALKSLHDNPRFPSLMESLDPATRIEVDRAVSSRSGPAPGKDIKSFIEERKKALQDNP